MDPRDSTSTHPQEDRSRGAAADALALLALPAIFVAFAATFDVLGSSDYASKFENGVLPTGFDSSPGQGAAIVSIICATMAVALIVTALAARVTKTSGAVAGLTALAAVPYGVLELFTWQLAF